MHPWRNAYKFAPYRQFLDFWRHYEYIFLLLTASPNLRYDPLEDHRPTSRMASSRDDHFRSLYAEGDSPLDTDPQSRFWMTAPPMSANRDSFGQPLAGIETIIRSRWTKHDLFVLFECVYQTLYLRPAPKRYGKTWKLWDWDVVELFIGDDWEHTERYKEFELSPQGEWLDLAIDRTPPDLERNREWASGFETAARIDPAQGIWYGAMRIPFAAITEATIEDGKEFRANFYRIEGPPGNRKLVAWRVTHSDSFHVPGAFGNLVLTL